MTMDKNDLGGGTRSDALAPVANNADLWTAYLRGQVRNWIDPFRLADPETVDVIARPLADMAASALASWTGLFAGPAVRVMYDGNKPQLNQFVAERAIDPNSLEIPAELTSRRPAPLPFTQIEEWAISPVGTRPVEAREPALV